MQSDPSQPIKPLKGVRIVEAAQMISAPLATSFLADQGAEVIKVEAVKAGDRMRSLGDIRNNIGSVFHSCNRGKQSIALDTKSDAGREVLLKLIDTADVFVQNFRPGAAERMGIGADEMLARNPGLIYVSVSGFGATGPYAGQMVYDFVIQGVTGLTAFEGLGEDKPRMTKNLTIDKATALTVSQAITAALFHHARTGEGQHLEVNMVEAGLQFLWPDGMWSHTLLTDDGELPADGANEAGIFRTPPMALNYEVRPTKDGYITVNLATNSTWERLATAIDPALMDDPRFATYNDRLDHGKELAAAVDAVLGHMTSDEALARLQANDIPCGHVYKLGEVHTDPQIQHNGSLIERESTSVGMMRDPRPAARFGSVKPEPGGSAPVLGEHTVAVLASLGYDDDAVAALLAANVVGD